jgi:hypothetical protein
VVKRVLCVIVGIICSIAVVLGIYDAMHPASDFMGAAVVGFVAGMAILIVTGLVCDSIGDD